MLEQIRKLGSNVLVVTPAPSRAIAGRARTSAAVTTLVQRDYTTLRHELTQVTRSSAVATGSFWVKAQDFSKNASIVGCEPDFFPIREWPVETGAVFDDAQNRGLERVALLGHTVATELFGTQSPVGRRILISRMPFVVIGVLQERGQGLDTANEDSQIYVPLDTAMRRLMNSDHFAAIVLQIESIDTMDDAASLAQLVLHRLHHVPANRNDDFQILNQRALIDTEANASTRLGFYLRSIGASALMVSGMGILGITWLSVKERTREIGVRRALGATSSDIFLQFWLENGTAALVGCILGLAFSWPISRAVAQMNSLPFGYDCGVAEIAVIASLALNALFTILPARKAARLDPMAALRYD